MNKLVITEMDGDSVTKKEIVSDWTPEEGPCVSGYARFFDETCSGWEKDPEYNLIFLRSAEVYFNDLLKARGHVFLNEVYDYLGIRRTKAGQVVGWVYNEKDPVGDNRISFGIYSNRNKFFVNGYESSILLDFNVDGCIIDKI